MKLKWPTNIKEARHFLSLTGYYQKFICNYSDIFNMQVSDCQSSFDMLCSQLTNMPVGQLPDPNKLYLLFTDASKFCYSDMLTQASTDKTNETIIKLLTDKDPIKSVESQTQDLQLKSNIVHPVAYISGSFNKSQCRWPTITKECFGIFMSIKKCSFYLQNADLLVHLDPKPLLKIFSGNTNKNVTHVA